MKNERVKKQKSKTTLARVLFYVKKYPVSWIGSLVFAAISVVTSLLVPVFFGDAIDCIIENGVLWAELKFIFIKIGVAAGIAAVAGWLLALCNNHISCNVVCDLNVRFAKYAALIHRKGMHVVAAE